MKTFIYVFAFLLLFQSIAFAKEPLSFEDVFHINRMSVEKKLGKTTGRRLEKAVEDLNAAIAGKKPLHAKIDSHHALPADGGTTYYVGDGYKITIIMSMNCIKHGRKNIDGYMYGPVITFDNDLVSGNNQTISYVTFYPDDKLDKLLKRNESIKKHKIVISVEK